MENYQMEMYDHRTHSDAITTEKISDFLEHHQKLTPSKTAINDNDILVSYEQLLLATQSLQQQFREIGLNKGDRVCIYANSSLYTVTEIFAANRMGLVFVPINKNLTHDQFFHIMNDCGAKAYITEKKLHEAFADENNYPSSIQHILFRETVKNEPTFSFESYSYIESGTKCSEPDNPLETPHDDLAAILYTSGSTGKAKGVMLTNRNILYGSFSVSEYLSVDKDDRNLLIMPMSFDYGLNQVMTTIQAGATLVLHNYILPQLVVKDCAKHKITSLAAVPHIWTNLSTQKWPEQAIDNLRYITNTGGAMPAPITKALGKVLPKTKIFLMYGLTEAFRSTYLDPGLVDEKPESIGKAIPYSKVTIVSDNGHECEPFEVGELVHSGPLVSLGYWNNKVKTEERFRTLEFIDKESENLSVWSGDKAYTDEDGLIYFVGRDDHMIKTHGFRISPNEIELNLQQSGLVTESAAIGIPDGAIGHRVVTYVLPEEGINTKDIHEYCVKHMPSYMVPKEIIELKELPKTVNSKIDKNKLVDIYRSNKEV